MDEERRQRRIGAVVLGIAAMLTLGAAAWRHNLLWLVHPPSDWVRVLDVSHHQGPIDWAAVRRDGVGGAWIKASEGGDVRDARFDENRKGAEAAGLRWGAYHFFTFCRPAEDQAANFLAALAGDAGTLPSAVDVETGGNCAAVPSPGPLKTALTTFMVEIEERLGRPLLVYVIPEQVPLLFEDDGPPSGHLWVRGLFSRPSIAFGALEVWQFHSRGWVAGVKGPVDLNAVPPLTWAGWGEVNAAAESAP
ncbi:lysozyme [Deltaproteobacteria bacterium]|nr:lysozyme [Deltaproteobacteria bacterium]